MLVSKGEAIRLHRVDFKERTIDENRLQELLFKHPALIPVDEIEPVFAPLIPVAREIPSPAGNLDLLYVNPEGYLTLVETKLWKNPQARREVVAQIIDYAKEFSKWGYDDLQNAITRARPDMKGENPLWPLVHNAEEEADQRSFVDTVSRCLGRGQFLLLIIGDGIHEGAEHMAAFLQRTPNLSFTLALVEMATYRRDPDAGGELFIQPRVMARTIEVERAVVRVEWTAPSGLPTETPLPGLKVAVTIPQPEPGTEEVPKSLTEKAFYADLETAPNAGPEVASFVKDIAGQASAFGVKADLVKAMALHYTDPEVDQVFTFAVIERSGKLWLKLFPSQYRRAGIDPAIYRQYLESIRKLIPELHLAPSGESLSHPRGELRIRDLMPHGDAWLGLMAETVAKIRQALGSE
jgi:hypothetical protein